MATLALIHRAAVDRHRWLTEEEFARDWALVQVAPGINLLALTILIGKRLAGWRGILLCMIGLLLPSVTITIALTAGYAQIQRQPLMQAALHGIIPATVGIGLVTAAQMARAPLKASRKEGVSSYLVAWSLLLLSALLSARYPGNVVPILGGAAALGGLTQVWLTKGRGESEGEREETASEGREEVAAEKGDEV